MTVGAKVILAVVLISAIVLMIMVTILIKSVNTTLLYLTEILETDNKLYTGIRALLKIEHNINLNDLVEKYNEAKLKEESNDE